MSRSTGSRAAPSPYIQTETGNIVSRQASIHGSQNIVLSGKSILSPNCVLRGDLRRTGASSSASGGGGGTVVIAMGKYCFVGESTVLRPCYKTYKGVFSYYPMKIGDYVTIGSSSVVEAASIGTGVEIGKNCIIGPLSILKDYCKIQDGAVVGAGTIVPSLTEWAESPARPIGQLPESTPEIAEAKAKAFHAGFKPE
ncbi:dynactin subunit 5 [Sporobolomyces salmoneus]|uniref:dynactin subunit 5 n=1 Tax=Sporobolomyces salmoneus TaxID=183962 RepID=UPI00318012CD